jgi:uncharacterized membrane protein YecN with MAPEG domain
MSSDTDQEKSQNRVVAIVVAYPFAILIGGIIVNIFVFGVKPYVVAFPSIEIITALVIAAILLVVNHAWLMTTTELTRVRFKMYSTPEEWKASGTRSQDASEEGVRELKRCHDTHHNTTENVVYSILLLLIFIFASPSIIAAQIWLLGFAVARLGYTYTFLSGKDNARGLFMTLSLLSMFGMSSYLALGLIV